MASVPLFGATMLEYQAAGSSKFLQNNASLYAQVISFAITGYGNELSHDLPTLQREHPNHYNYAGNKQLNPFEFTAAVFKRVRLIRRTIL